MTTTIAIALFEGVTALDALGPYQVLVEVAGTEIVFVAEGAGPVSDSQGRLTIQAHAAFAEVPEPDVILVPGGLVTVAMARARNHPIIDWIAAAHPTTTWTTSVCTGSHLLGAAGVLEGREATGHWYLRQELVQFGAIPVDRRVVFDGKVVTAAGVSAGIDMALALAARLSSDDTARSIQLGMEYDPAPPFRCGHPSVAPPEIVAGLSAGFAAAIERG